MQAFHRFTPTSLGVNTTSPQFNLDVNGSAAVNSLNGVQMAERFSGSDAAAKINACLTRRELHSGVCDAHGLTGTLTATSHIAIPAGTTLLWGQAQLTINDTTNNDAVELLGDGSSLDRVSGKRRRYRASRRLQRLHRLPARRMHRGEKSQRRHAQRGLGPHSRACT